MLDFCFSWDQIFLTEICEFSLDEGCAKSSRARAVFIPGFLTPGAWGRAPQKHAKRFRVRSRVNTGFKDRAFTFTAFGQFRDARQLARGALDAFRCNGCN